MAAWPQQSLLLLQLPNEVIHSILEQVDTTTDLCTVARTCSRLQSLAERLIYRSVLLTKVDGHLQTACLAQSLAAPAAPNRASFIRKLHVNKPQCLEEGQYDSLPSVVESASKLRELVVEALPSTIFHGPARDRWMVLQNQLLYTLQTASLQSPTLSRPLSFLRSCSLYLVDSSRPLFSIGPFTLIFLHPTLVELRILRASICDPVVFSPILTDPSRSRSTPLKTLRLEHCDISASGLAVILKVPRALESLTVIECQDSHCPILYGYMDPFSLVNAIIPHHNTLKSLSLDLNHRAIPHRSAGLNLMHFDQIEYLEVSLFTVCNGSGKFVILPPNLRHLHLESAFFFADLNHSAKVLGGRWVALNIAKALVEKCRKEKSSSDGPIVTITECTAVPDVEIELRSRRPGTLSRLDTVTLSFLTETGDVSSQKAVLQLGKAYKEAGIRLVVNGTSSVEYFQPPFLYGEPMPTLSLEYDSLAPAVETSPAACGHRVDEGVADRVAVAIAEAVNGGGTPAPVAQSGAVAMETP